MGLMSAMSLATRLLLGFGAMLMLLVGMALLSLTRMNDLSATLERITVESAARNQAIGSLNQGIGGYVQAIGALGSTDLEQGPALLQNLNRVVAQYEEAEAKLEALLPGDAAVRRLFDDVKAKGRAAREVIGIATEKAEGRGDAATAFYIRSEYSGAIDRWNTLQQAWASSVAVLGNWSQQADADLAAATNESAARTQLLIVGGGLVTVLLGSALALWIIRDTQRAIGAAVEATARMADHDLSQPIVTDRGDEIGGLLRALEKMRTNLHDLAAGVRAACDDITAASGEIAQGSMELSARTEKAASTLQSTVGTIAQLTESVNQTTESARSANQLAADANQVANRGGAVVAEAVSTMGEINSASQKIADIIAIIDGLPDEHPGAQRGGRGCARGRAGSRLRGGRKRGPGAGRPQRRRGARDQGPDRGLAVEGADRHVPGRARRQHDERDHGVGAARLGHDRRHRARGRPAARGHRPDQPVRVAARPRRAAERRAGRAVGGGFRLPVRAGRAPRPAGREVPSLDFGRPGEAARLNGPVNPRAQPISR
jgi:CHASE3 domain sensor protein